MYEYTGDLINRRVKAFFIPGFVATLTVTLSMFLDILLVGRMVGSMAMGAVNMAMPVTMFFNMIYMLFGTGGEVLVAAAKGAREPQRADAMFSLTMIIVVTLSVLLAAGGSIFAFPIADALDKGISEMTPLIAHYIRILFLGCPLLLIVMSLAPFVKADAMPRLSAFIAIFSNVVNIVSKIIYMGPLKMGITGAALGTVTGYGAGLALICVCYVFNRRRRVLNFVMPKSDEWKDAANIFLTGLPSSLGQGLGALTSWVSNAIVISIAGTKGMAALTAANSCVIFAYSFRYASPMTIVPLVGAMFGERDWWAMTQTTKRVLLICVTGTAFFTALFEAFPRRVLGCFGITDPEIMAMGTTALRFFAVNIIFVVIIHILMTYYQTTGRKTVSILLSAGMEVADLSMRWICSSLFGIIGIWISPLLASIVILAFIAAYAKYIEKTTAGEPIAYHGHFIIHERQPIYAEKYTLASKEEDANGFADVIKGFAEKNGSAPETAEEAGRLAKEAALEIVRKNGAAGRSIDAMATSFEGGVYVKLRDDGPAFGKDAAEDAHISHAAVMGYNDTFVKVKPETAAA